MNSNHPFTINCLPESLCSWNYRIRDAKTEASVQYDWITETGTIEIGEHSLQIKKHGLTSGYWTLQTGSHVYASAQKISAFHRGFDIETELDQFKLRARSVFSRSFTLTCAEQPIADIVPVHLFTRRATISVHSSEYDLALMCFSFWLVGLMWKRQANQG